MAPKEPDASGLAIGADGFARCFWRDVDPLYHDYHDREWGTPIASDAALFERISLEGFQSGLSWLVVLRKRDAFRRAFAGFDVERVARFGAPEVERLMADPGLVRHRRKIAATIGNARCARALIAEAGSLGAWFWSFEPRDAERGPIDLAHWRGVTRSSASVEMADALKARGWSFVGPTTYYALMQAIGMVNDHMDGCACRADVDRRRARFVRPGAATGPGHCPAAPSA